MSSFISSCSALIVFGVIMSFFDGVSLLLFKLSFDPLLFYSREKFLRVGIYFDGVIDFEVSIRLSKVMSELKLS
jgi:hypothetical protein